MNARRAIAAAKMAGDARAERKARRAVHEAKLALGERGAVWWSDDAPDLNRYLVANTSYASWYDRAVAWEQEILALLAERAAEASVCPSEVARSRYPEGWRSYMEEVRDAARQLARDGAVVITQKGKRVDPEESWKGAIRIRLATESRRSARSLPAGPPPAAPRSAPPAKNSVRKR